MSFSQLYPPKEEKDVASTVHEKWQRAKKAGGAELTAFYTDLYNSKETQPYWNNILQVLKETHSEENLEFFAENIERMNNEKFTLLKWKEFYSKWIRPDERTPPLINITDAELQVLNSLDKEISKKYKNNDIINFKNTHVIHAEISFGKPKIYSGNQLLGLIATKLLMIVNQDKYITIGDVLKEEKKEEKKSGKAEKNDGRKK